MSEPISRYLELGRTNFYKESSIETNPKASFWGELLCGWKCQGYDGYSYNPKTDTCVCKGNWTPPPLWRGSKW